MPVSFQRAMLVPRARVSTRPLSVNGVVQGSRMPRNRSAVSMRARESRWLLMSCGFKRSHYNDRAGGRATLAQAHGTLRPNEAARTETREGRRGAGRRGRMRVLIQMSDSRAQQPDLLIIGAGPAGLSAAAAAREGLDYLV